MILKSKDISYKRQATRNKVQGYFAKVKLLAACSLVLAIFNYASCKYSFKDVSIPLEVKTFRVNYLENKARYVNTQLSPMLTEQLKLKIISNTRLHQTNDDSAHYDISGYVSDYSISTTGVSGNTSSTNRLNVTFHLIFKNNLDPSKSAESDVTYTKDFAATLSLDEVGTAYNTDMTTYLVDQIFNKIFSNW
jgi:hypothetical protein